MPTLALALAAAPARCPSSSTPGPPG